MACAQAVSRIHPTTGSVTRRNSQPRMLAPLSQQPQKKEWTIADARALEASIADQKKAFSKAEERRTHLHGHMHRHVMTWNGRWW